MVFRLLSTYTGGGGVLVWHSDDVRYTRVCVGVEGEGERLDRL